MTRHGIALRTPWYVGVRGEFDRFDPQARAPAIQKYDRDDFVDVLVADPSASVQFDDSDRWSFAMPRAPGSGTTIRERLSTHRLIPSPMRKLYQPSHQRFYAVTIELFCDAPGLPRPAPGDDPAVTFVVRRLLTTATGGTNADRRKLAKAAAVDFLCQQDLAEEIEHDDTVGDVTAMVDLHHDAADEPRRTAFAAANATLLATVDLTHELQSWYVGADGRGRWAPVGTADPRLKEEELELPMWRIPAQPAVCERARTRSLWFGVVPTFSADLDRDGKPRFDDRATYALQCVARRVRPAPHAHCPPDVGWSGTSRPYRIAPFFDPAGTAQRPVRVKLPDFRTLAAHAGTPRPAGAPRPAGGGVQFERPPGSQLPPVKFGEIPTGVKAQPGGATAEFCSFSIELITIVAMFVLSIFLPIVVFVFQLWWLLLLKFCWPRPTEVAALLSALENTRIGSLNPTTPVGKTMSKILGVEASEDAAQDVLAKLSGAPAFTGLTPAKGSDLVEELALIDAPPPAGVPPAEQPVTDPLC